MSGTSAKRPVQIDDLYAIKGVADAQLSPDGRLVAYVLSEIDREADDYRTSIWVVSSGGGTPPRRFTSGPKTDSAPRWSPDGTSLAFLSDRDGGAPQLYVMPAGGGEGRKLTSLEKGAGAAVWSPDGRRIAFSARFPAEAPPADKEARRRWDQRPKVITRAQYKTDGQGYTLDAPARLFVVGVEDETQDLRPFVESDGEDRSPAWSPEEQPSTGEAGAEGVRGSGGGTRLAFTRTRSDVGDYSLSDLWVLDVETKEARRLTENVGRAAAPSWSPDGKTIAVFGTDEQEPGFGEHSIRVWLVPAGGGTGKPHGGAEADEGVRRTRDEGAARNLTAEYDRGAYLASPPAVPAGPVWAPDGGSVTYSVSNEGCIQVVRAAVSDGAVRPVISGDRWVTGFSASADRGRMALVANAPDQPGDVYVCDWQGAGERKLTDVNREWMERVALPRVERRRFASPHGHEIDGWLFMPAGTAERAPLLLQIHGGPHSFAGSQFQATAFYCYALAARGWACLALNPTGSGSYGKAFAHGIRERWGEHDLPEQLAAADALIEEGLVDPKRLAVTGYSYGGYMTSWTIGHSDRFKAAVVGAPVTNFESFHGSSDIGLWFSPWELRGAIHEKRELYRRLSPIQSAHECVTPTLILHGEADARCPIGQGEELYSALVAANRAPVEFVRYPGGPHGFVSTGRPSHRVDYSQRVVDWMEQYVTSPTRTV